MKFIFSRDLKYEILDVDKAFKKSLFPWWEDISVYLERLEDDITWNSIPVLVLSIYKFQGFDRSLTIQMANLFKMIYFANSIHAFVKDDSEGQEHNRELQFNILIGDYIFGRILKLLHEAKVDKLLQIFSEMICEINEGMVMKHKLSAGYKQVLAKTKASIYSTAFLTAAELSNVEDEEKELFRQLGYNLGMSIELPSNDASQNEIMEFINKSEYLFRELNQQKNAANSSLEEIIKEIHDMIYDIDKAAVV